ncbi:hypothetical protein [Ensifer aridi]|uniref:hypothetical protein n=1 Tax=Ensifer aridi TaxID=1708715 RepID=UPI00111BE38C|nr:hypothetical protein [Ensifer aridi]
MKVPLRVWFTKDRFGYRCISAILVGGSTAIFFLYGPFLRLIDGSRTKSACAIVLGGMLSGGIFSGWIGRNGLAGWLVAFCTMWLCAMTCGFVVGTLLLPLSGSLIGAGMAPGFSSKASPHFWLASFVSVQTIMLLIRRI